MDLSKEQTIKLLQLADMEIDFELIMPDDITRALLKIEQKLLSQLEHTELFESNAKVLIIDDLELSTYQLSTLLKRIKVTPVVVHTKADAINEIKKQKFDFLFVDLFLPDETDGLEVMSYANTFRTERNCNYKIVAISGTDDLELVTNCFNAGVDEFVSKSAKWHEQILKIIINKNDYYTRKNFIRYDIDENTVTYNVKSLSKPEFVEELYNNITSELVASVKNIVLNLENISVLPAEYAAVFTEIYKKCSRAGGRFIVLNPSEEVRKVFDFDCLSEVFTVVDTPEDAFAILNK